MRTAASASRRSCTASPATARSWRRRHSFCGRATAWWPSTCAATATATRTSVTRSALADDVGWICEQLDVTRAVVVGHSLGGLVALELAAERPDLVQGAVLIDSVLLAGGGRTATVAGLVTGLRGPDGDRVLRDYFRRFFGPDDDPAVCDWILDQAVRTPAHVTSSIWEEASSSWNDADALVRCRSPLLYLDAGTANADLERAVRLNPSLMLGAPSVPVTSAS